MNQYNIKYIKLNCEFECYPLWILPEDDLIFKNINHHDFIFFSTEDKVNLDLFYKLFQNTYNKSVPQDSDFKNYYYKNEFNELSKVISTSIIKYFPNLVSLKRWDVISESYEWVVGGMTC